MANVENDHGLEKALETTWDDVREVKTSKKKRRSWWKVTGIVSFVSVVIFFSALYRLSKSHSKNIEEAPILPMVRVVKKTNTPQDPLCSKLKHWASHTVLYVDSDAVRRCP